MKNKRGSHVGVVLSFMIFITFLAFLYVTLAPSIKIQEDKKAILDYLEIALTENLSERLTSISVVIDNTTSEDCIKLKGFMNQTYVNPRLIVKDKSVRIFPAEVSGIDLFIDRESTGTYFFKIRISDEFEEADSGTMSGSSCADLDKGPGYTIGSIIANDYFFETRIEKLKNSYDADYDSLRDDFSISVGNEFGFDFEYANGTNITTGNKETKASIYIEEMPVQYVDKKGDINLGLLRIKVW